MNLHERFSTVEEPWHRWLFDRIALPEGARVLEFGLETGPAQLAPFFADRHVERLEGELRVTEVEPVLAYIRSSFVYDGRALDDAAETVGAAIASDGAFRIGTNAGLISCRKP
jgi:hypothetical protein